MNKELKIGVFVVAVLVASFFVLNYLRGEDIFNNEIEVSARYEDLGGLVASAPVYIKGYKAGKVSDVRYDTETGDFLVTCSILKEFNVPDDSRMTIYGVDIMGGKGIRIDLGLSGTMVEDGGMLLSDSEPGLIDGLAAGVGPLMEKAGNTLDSLNVMVSSVNALLADKNIPKTIAHLEKTMASVQAVSASIEGKSEELNVFIDNLASMSDRLYSVSAKADTLVGTVNSMASSVDMEEIRGLISSFHELLGKINDPDGTIGRLLVDDSVYLSVDQLLSDVDVLVQKIQENPKKYIKISVF